MAWDTTKIPNDLIQSSDWNAQVSFIKAISGVAYPISLSGSKYTSSYKWYNESAQKLSTISGSLSSRLSSVRGISYWSSQSNKSIGSIYYDAGEVVIGPSGTDYGNYKLQVSGQTFFSGMVVFNGTTFSGLSAPTFPSSAVNKKYVDTISSNILSKFGNGYATVAHGGTISHGLSGKPTYISVVPSGMLVNYGISCRADNTNITVYMTATGDRDVYWMASIL